MYTHAYNNNNNNNTEVIQRKKALICCGPGLKIKSAYQLCQAKANLLERNKFRIYNCWQEEKYVCVYVKLKKKSLCAFYAGL